MKKTLLLSFVLLLCLNFFSLKAQQGDTIEIQRNKNHRIVFARFKPNANRKQTNGAAFLSTVLSAKSDYEFRLAKETTDELGITHQRYAQYWKGIKIDNEEYLIHGKNRIIEVINGEFPKVDIASVSPTINEQSALARALAYVGSKKYKWEDDRLDSLLKGNTKNIKATYHPKGELVITKDDLKGSDKFLLSWKFSISSLEPENEQIIYVDASNGNVIRDIPMICNANIACTAQTRYSATQNITGDTFTGGNRLREVRTTTSGNSVNVVTLNIQNGSNYANAIDFANSSTTFTSSSWATFNQDQPALDVHWGIERVLDYWSTVRQRNGINANGLQATNYVHYYDPNSPAGWPNNAQWDNIGLAMRFGDGDGVLFHPVVALDVTAHELGHRID